ncbi:MAG: AarF/UbiB family protein [Leptospiraceae bacterium]|nr:AarF/UbiB family protein [Leptospiraceae bacterium]MDW8306356.1 AarF/UbiB family protein [Leptospiraceae bacterium]
MRLRRPISEMRRLLQVATIIFDFAIDIFISRMYRTRGLRPRPLWKRLLAFLLRWIFRRGKGTRSFAVELRLTLERLGPTYIKLGQILSLREDILPESITRELRKLQSDVPPFPFVEVKRVIENEFNLPLSMIFSKFEEEPIAAASLAQAHVAWLRDGTKAVVKVQRPGIVPIIMNDLSIIKKIAALLMYIPFIRDFRPDRFAEEFANYTMRELDFRQEGKHADIFRRNFQGFDKLIVPKIYWEYTSTKVLTMEFIEGVKPDDTEKLRRLGVNGYEMAKLGADIVIKQLFIDGFFHGDPHPGNLFVVGNDRFGMIDLGMIGSFTRQTKRAMFLYYYHLIIQDFETSAKYMVGLTEPTPNADIKGFMKEIVEIGKNWYGAGFKQYSLGRLILDALNQGATYKLYFNNDVVLAIKAIVTIEAVAHILHPGVDLAEISRPMMTRIFLEQFSPWRAIQALLRALPDYVEFQDEAPRKLLKAIDMFSSGKLQVEVTEAPKQEGKNHLKSPLFYFSLASFFTGIFFSISPYTPGPVITSLPGLMGIPILTLLMFLLSFAGFFWQLWRMR